MPQPSFRISLACFVLALAALAAAPVVGQPPPPPGGPAPAAAPPPDAPNPPPASPEDVTKFFAKLIAAKPADVDTLATKSADFPFCRLRLYVAPTVGEKTIVGVDYGVFRASGKVRTIALSAGSPTFRTRLNRLLADPVSASSKNGEAGVRIVDFWCQRTDQSSSYVPLLAKVWSNSKAADIPKDDGVTPVPGVVCHDDLPAIAECQHAFDFSPPVFKSGMTEIEVRTNAQEDMAKAIIAHRTAVAELISRQSTDRPTTSRTPPTPGSDTAEAVISLNSTHALSDDVCIREGAAPRVLAGGESFIGLTPDSKEGKVTLEQRLPFPIGGGVIRAPSRITSPMASIDVEVSRDKNEWLPIYLLEPAQGASISNWEATGDYPLPESLRGAQTIQIRARLASTEEKAGLDRAGGPRFLDVVFRVPRTKELRVDKEKDKGRVAVIACHDQLDGVDKPFQIVVQPERLNVQAVADLMQSGRSDIDLYSPCDLDQQGGDLIAKHDGTIRFRSPDDWQQHPPEWLPAMAAGRGTLVFAALKEPTAALATALATGKKSLAFPLADKPDVDLLAALAKCSAGLALDGVRELSAEQTSALKAFAGPTLSLASLEQATIAEAPGPILAAALVASSGTLTFQGPALPDAGLLATLVGGEKHLVFDGAESLDPQAAAAIAASGNAVFLPSVQSLPQEAADPLLAYAGPFLALPRLERAVCGFEALAPGEKRTGIRLRSVIRQAAMGSATADAQSSGLDKELESILAAALDRGLLTATDKDRIAAELKTGGPALAEVVDRLSEVLPLVPQGTRLDVRTGTPLAAILEAPGIFVLRPSTNPTFRMPTDKVFWESLARGRKHLDLSGLTSLDPTAAAALATTDNMLSLDGLSSLSPEVATALAAYKGPFLSLNGVEPSKFNPMADAPIMAAFEQLVRDGRASLAGLYMVNVDTLRAFAQNNTAALGKPLAAKLTAAGKPQTWTSKQGQRSKAWVKVILNSNVIFDTDRGPSDKIKSEELTPASVNVVKKLAEDAQDAAIIRSKTLFEAAPVAESR